MTVEEIYRRHSEERRKGFWRSPIIVMDDRTAKDKSVVLVAHSLLPRGRAVLKAVRFDPTQVVSACMNLEVANMDIYESEALVRQDGVFHGF